MLEFSGRGLTSQRAYGFLKVKCGVSEKFVFHGHELQKNEEYPGRHLLIPTGRGHKIEVVRCGW